MKQIILAAFLLATAAPAAARTPLEVLQGRLEAVAAASPGRVGLAAVEVASGRTLLVRGAERFPMASTVKIAVAATVLDQVAHGRLSATRLYPVKPELRVRSDGITDVAPHPGAAFGIDNLLEMSLTLSDNSATDVLLDLIGGPPAVTAFLRRHGIDGIRVDRNIARLILDDGKFPMEPGRTAAESLALHSPVEHWITYDGDWGTNPAFDADPRDTATPAAMAALLVKLRRGELLDAARTRQLLDILARCRTGAKRVRALLPDGTPWAHKTGTLEGIGNDAGLLTLPDGREVALAVFAVGVADAAVRDRTMAELGRLVFDGLTLVE